MLEHDIRSGHLRKLYQGHESKIVSVDCNEKIIASCDAHNNALIHDFFGRVLRVLSRAATCSVSHSFIATRYDSKVTILETDGESIISTEFDSYITDLHIYDNGKEGYVMGSCLADKVPKIGKVELVIRRPAYCYSCKKVEENVKQFKACGNCKLAGKKKNI